MGADAYLNNQLLVAMPSLADPNFSHSVMLICEHNERGALGIVINRPLDMRMSEILDQLSLATQDLRLRDMPVLAGLPILLGMHDLFHWTHADLYEVGSETFDPVLYGKRGYLNIPFYIGRYVLFFGITHE